MKNVFVSCCTIGNLGDDLFLISLLKRYADVPGLRFHIICDESYRLWEQRYPNLVCHSYRACDADDNLFWKFGSSIRELCMLRSARNERYDATVQIAGSIFIEPRTSNKFKQRYLRWRSLKALEYVYRSSDNIFIMGSNFGPCYSKGYVKKLRKYYQKYCNDICFRDQKSASLFRDLKNVRYAPDILFGYPIKDCEHKKNVFISVVDLSKKGQESSKSPEQYEHWLVREIQNANSRGYTVTLCSFCDGEGDAAVVERLAEVVGKRGGAVEKMYYRGNPDAILDKISVSEYVIASRFHASILSLSAGCRVLPVIYSAKTRNVLCDMGYPIECCVDLTSDNSDIFKHDVFDAQYVALRGIKQRAESHFEMFDQWVRS